VRHRKSGASADSPADVAAPEGVSPFPPPLPWRLPPLTTIGGRQHRQCQLAALVEGSVASVTGGRGGPGAGASSGALGAVALAAVAARRGAGNNARRTRP